MNKYFYGALPIILTCLAAIGNSARGQSNYKITDTKDIDITLLGTSTLHKWEMHTKTVKGFAQFGFNPGNEKDLTSLKSLAFSLEVKTLKSESEDMDKNANKALRSAEHKEISYALTSATVSLEKANTYLIQTQGKLTIAGITKEIAMDVHCVIDPFGTITTTGTDHLNMTDYNIKPPSFLLGAMKTGDAVILNFVVVYKKEKGV